MTIDSHAPALQAGEAARRELTLSRSIAALPKTLYRAWTEPELLKQWFAPAPWSVAHVELDVRPGGSTLIVMRDPSGAEHPNRGVYLEVVENERLVFTDAYVSAWAPSPKPFMTAIVSFSAAPGGAIYMARVLHWSVEDRRAHEEMGFHEGWGQCADQLAALAAAL